MDPDVRHLRSFRVLGEELHFTRAAERLHLAQQTLSTHVRQLETRIGVRLVERTTRAVALTAAGEAFHRRAAAVLDALDDAVGEARRTASGLTGRLTVGMLGTSGLELTSRILRTFSREHPDVSTSLRNVPFDDPSGGVRDGATDVALVWLPFRTAGLHLQPLLAEPRVALLAPDHPLAARTTLEAADLVQEPFGWIDGLDETALDFWTLAEHRTEATPRVGAHISGFEDLIAAVRLGQAVACTPDAIAATFPPGAVVRRPVRDAAPAIVAVCRRADDDRPLSLAFERVAAGCAEAPRGA